jgi:hypothetical protein
VSTHASTAPRAGHSAASNPLPRAVWAFAAGLYVVLVGACWLTRDYGYYFDDKLHVEAVRVTFETGVPLPRYYHYPSFSYLVSLLAAVPTWAGTGFDGRATAALLADALQRNLQEPTPRLVHDARALFAAVAHLGLFWTAAIAWRLSRSRLAACTAVLALGLSFEFHYHARIWSTDATMAQFALLSVLFALRYLESGRRRDFLLAAVVAGIAAGTKFPGAMALAAGGTAALALELRARPPAERLRALLAVTRSCLLGLLVLVVTFLLTTPGALVDGPMFRDHVAMELRHYRAEGSGGIHEPYGVDSGFDHFSRQVVYLAVQAFSYAPAGALCLFAFALFGVLHTARRSVVEALVVFSVPALYVAYFSYQRLMAVRNFEVLLGFLAVAAGVGVHALWTSGIPRALRATLLGAAALALAWNVQFLVHADRSILARRELDWGAELRAFVAASRKPLFLAPRARELAALDQHPGLDAKLAFEPREASYVVLMMPFDLTGLVRGPGFRPGNVLANWPRVYQPLEAGPWEVNFSYYPTWAGDPRPVVVTARYYRTLLGDR